ncbi:hypothetical protein [Engelhardtia mirabilis]|uniref:Uncharacterized protein n=1 Tax=Engelhardtia mirabilis TaxID=2528011 RepID=A0A518BRL3_9BACT|nr:hypothetical protein Pla133_47370 [Planctomycetes bacterium Pla133]QDV03943.1 hypothetical protein Pla86_47350 [Planctomycetes bacterium Pla86]
MASSFESSDNQSHQHLKPLRVPSLKDGIYATAKELVEDLPGWSLMSEDEANGVLNCERKARPLSGNSRVTIKVEGPEGVPSTTVTLRSESDGGLRKCDKANIVEFMKLLHRRVV